MAIPTTGVSLSSLQSEFGGANPIKLSEYYKGGTYVPSGQSVSATDGTAISTTGVIRVGMFRGITKTASAGIVSSLSGMDLWDDAVYPNGAAAGVTFSPDGSISYAGISSLGPPKWYSVLTTGIGAYYYIRLTVISGNTPSSGQIQGTWWGMGSNRTWLWQAPPVKSATIRFDISDSNAGTNIVATTGNVSVFAQQEI